MNIDIEAVVIAAGAFVTAIGAVIVLLYNTRHTARKDEVTLLQGEVSRLAARLERADGRIDELERENRDLHRQIVVLLAENAALHVVLTARGIVVPASHADLAPPEAHAQRTGNGLNEN